MSLMDFGFTKNNLVESGRSKAELGSSDVHHESNSPVKSQLKPIITKPEKVKSPTKCSPVKAKSPIPQKTGENKTPIKHSPINAFEVESPKYSPTKNPELNLPAQRVKIIMKSCPDVDSVPQEALQVITKAAEMFISHLVNQSIEQSGSSKLDYDCLSDYIHSNDYVDFLKETVPKKLTWAECQKLIEERATENQNDLI